MENAYVKEITEDIHIVHVIWGIKNIMEIVQKNVDQIEYFHLVSVRMGILNLMEYVS